MVSETEVRVLRAALDSAREGVMICHGGIVEFANGAAAKLFAAANAAALLGLPIERLVSDGVPVTSATKAHDCRLSRLDGTVVGATCRSSWDEQHGRLTLWLEGAVTGEDVFGLLEERVRSDPLFENILQGAPYGMSIIDAAGRIVFVNERLGALFGYEPHELVGQKIEVLIPERYRFEHVAQRAHYAERPALRAMGAARDLTGQHRDGSEIPVEIGLNAVRCNDVQLVVAAVVDISERKRLELELRQANTNLEEFSYVASHDLKSPLRGISDLIEWIAEDLPEPLEPKVRHNLDRVRIRVQRMERIIDDLLAYARAGRATDELSEIEPEALVHGILELHPVPPGFEVNVSISATPFKGARTPLETVVRNLISNAIKHHDRQNGQIAVRVAEQDSFCVFSVSDDGPGIPAASHDRVFKLFQTASASRREGSGIGLALAKRLVECHGGRIMLASPNGDRGTTLAVFWPRFQRRDLSDYPERTARG